MFLQFVIFKLFGSILLNTLQTDKPECLFGNGDLKFDTGHFTTRTSHNHTSHFSLGALLQFSLCLFTWKCCYSFSRLPVPSSFQIYFQIKTKKTRKLPRNRKKPLQKNPSRFAGFEGNRYFENSLMRYHISPWPALNSIDPKRTDRHAFKRRPSLCSVILDRKKLDCR